MTDHPNPIFCQCQMCLTPTRCQHIHFRKNTGLIITRYTESINGTLCFACIQDLHRKYLVHNLLLGWWGIISFFVNIGYIMDNYAQYTQARRYLTTT